jgi:hypothetical protein
MAFSQANGLSGMCVRQGEEEGPWEVFRELELAWEEVKKRLVLSGKVGRIGRWPAKGMLSSRFLTEIGSSWYSTQSNWAGYGIVGGDCPSRIRGR